ncbi:MAG: sugar phosphate isomerase/epimerase family protein [Bacteroidota bacterium]
MDTKPFVFHRMGRRKAVSGLISMGLFPSFIYSGESYTQQKVYRESEPQTPFTYCLNTSTIMGQKLDISREIKLAAAAGYEGIEIWIRSLQQYVDGGGSLRTLAQFIQDQGIRVENAIGFAPWIVDNNDARSKGLDQAKREMDMLAQIGCKRIAAPPAGATQGIPLALDRVAERFRTLMDLGVEMGVIPQLEIWGFSKNLHTLSQVLYVASACGHPDTRILPDVYHLYKGGSDFDGLKLLNGHAVDIFHINDYPLAPSRTEIQDKDRVYPGDGAAPLNTILQDLATAQSPIILSLELFNRSYWEQDPLAVARTGLQKMKDAVESSKTASMGEKKGEQ